MKALSILSLTAGLALSGCLGTAPDQAIASHDDGLDAVTPDAQPQPDPERALLASDLWCPACVADGLRARLSHDVRFHADDDGVVMVEIDGALACAGHATAPEMDFLVLLEAKGEGDGGEDEGNPDPEPALDDELPPSPAPPPSVGGGNGEDEGNPDPEPALDHLPVETPGVGDPSAFGQH